MYDDIAIISCNNPLCGAQISFLQRIETYIICPLCNTSNYVGTSRYKKPKKIEKQEPDKPEVPRKDWKMITLE